MKVINFFGSENGSKLIFSASVWWIEDLPALIIWFAKNRKDLLWSKLIIFGKGNPNSKHLNGEKEGFVINCIDFLYANDAI